MKVENEELEQAQALNKVMIEMAKRQRASYKTLVRVYVVTVVCFTILLVSMVVGFFYYESQFEFTDTVTTTTKTVEQEVSGEGSEINNVEGNMYKDNAIHNQGGE